MPRLKMDKRTLEYETRPETHARLVERLGAWLRSEVDLAKDFADILESKHFYDEDCASLMEYARKIGYDGARARKLASLGQAIALEPALEDDLVSGQIPFESGASLYAVLADPVLRDKADWRALAKSLSPGGLKGHIRRLQEELARGTTELRLFQTLITEKDRDDFRRLKYLLQGIEKRTMTDGEVVSRAVNDSLDLHDPVRRARRMLAKKRRKPRVDGEDPEARKARLETQARKLHKRNRHIPVDVVYEVLDRSDGRCEVGGCTWLGPTDLMHVLRGYAEGGDHDPRNVCNGCPRHHRLVDAGRLKCLGFSDDGRPVFEDSKGRLLYPDPRPLPPNAKSDA